MTNKYQNSRKMVRKQEALKREVSGFRKQVEEKNKAITGIR